MKLRPTARLAFPLASAIAALLAAQSANAIIYYWDNNGTATGLSASPGTSGTWNGATNLSNTYAAVPQGNLDGTAALQATGLATTNADSIYFGTNNLSLGSTASTVGTTGAITINNIVIGTGQTNPFTLSGAGIITLAGTTPTITVNTTSATATIASQLTGAAGMVKAGAGTLILTSNANNFTGGVTIAGGGTLQVGNGTSGSLTSQALTFNNGGGVFNGLAAVAGSTQAMGALTFSTTGIGEGTVQSTYGTSGNAVLSFTSMAARGAGATGNFVISGGSNGTTNKIVLTGASTGTLLDRGLFFGGSSYAAYDTGGFVRAHGSGDTGYLAAPTGATMGSPTSSSNVELTTGNITAQTTASANTINMGANSITMDGTSQILSTNGILSSGSASATIGGGTTPFLQTATGSAEMVIRVNGSSDVLTISSGLQNNGTTPLTKTGAGTLILSGTSNSYSGTTTINAGTLAVNGGTAIANAGAVVLANAAGATFRLDNNNETIGSLSGGGFSGGNVDVGANTLTLAGTSTFGGKLIGSGGVTVSAGTLTLSNKNTFAGTITLNGTSQLTLSYGNDGTSSTPTASSGGTISMGNGTSLLMNPTAQVAAGLAQGGQGGSVAFGNFYSNPIVVSSGTASIKQGPAGLRYVLSGGVTGGTSGAQTLSILQGASGGNAERTTITVSGIIQDGSGGSTLGVSADFLAASSTSQGAFICLSGLNTFTGPIVVNNTKALSYIGTSSYRGGWFVIGGEITSGFSDRTVTTGSGALGWNGTNGDYSGTISLATGTILNYASSAAQTLGGAISGGGNIVKEGAGTLTLTSATSSYSGTTTISTGILNANSTSALGNGSATNTLIFNGGTLQAGGAITSPSTRLVTLTGTGLIDTNSNAVSIAGIMSGAGGVTKSGANTLTLSNANTYTGATTVNAGTLTLSGNRTAVTTGGYNLNTAGTAILNIQNGNYGIGGSFVMGALGGNATVNHSAGTISSVGGSGLIMGNGTSTSNYNLSGGALTISTANGIIMGTNAGTSSATPSVSTITVSGALPSTTTLTVSTLRIGRYDASASYSTTNTFAQTGGTTTVTTLGMGGLNTDIASTGPIIANLNLTGGVFTATNFVALSRGGATTAPNANSSFITIGGTAQVTLGAYSGAAKGTNSTATITFDTTPGGGGFLAPVVASATYMPAGTFTKAYLTANGANFNVPTLKNITIGQSLENAVSPAAAGTLTKSGVGTLTLSGANTYTGATTLSGGILSVGSIGNGGIASGNLGSATNAAANIVFDGGTLKYTGASATSDRAFTINGGKTATIDTTNDISFAGATGAATNGALTKIGGGKLTLTGTNTYSGATTISAGVLAVNGSLANTTTTVGNTATLQGSGTVGGSVTIQSGGTLAAGNSIESLGVGNISHEAGSTFAYELQTNLYAGTPNAAGDLTYSTGTLDIAAGTFLTLGDLAASTVLANDSKLTLISYFGGWTSGELFTYNATTLNDGATFTLGLNEWRFDYDDLTGGPNFASDQAVGVNARFVTMTVIPEPRAALLGGLGLLALLRRRRS